MLDLVLTYKHCEERVVCGSREYFVNTRLAERTLKVEASGGAAVLCILGRGMRISESASV